MQNSPTLETLTQRISDLESELARYSRTESPKENPEEKYRLILENISDTVIITDDLGNMRYVCPNTTRIFGVSQAEIYGLRTIQRLMNRTICDPSALEEQHEIRDIECSIRRPDGQRRYLLVDAKAVDIDGGTALYVMHDVTSQKRMEEAYIDSEAHLQSLVNSIPDLVWLKDPDGVYLKCNPTFERFFGAKESEIIGKTDYDFVDKALADFFRDHDRKALEGGRPSLNEETLRFASGGYQGLFETIKTPIHDSSGRLIGVLGVARDITEREKAKEAIKKSQTELHDLLQAIQAGIMVHSVDTSILEVNPAASRMLGIPREKLIGKKAVDGQWRFIDENGRLLAAEDFPVNIVKRTHSALADYIIGFKKPDQDAPVWILVNATPKFSENGALYQIIVSAVDISELKRAQSQLVQKQQQLIQAQKMESIGSLAGGIAHDFNNILSSIIGFTELTLEAVEKGSELEDNLQEIFAAGKRAQELVKQILTFARQSDEKLMPLHVDAIVGEVLKFMRSSIPATIEIEQRIDSDALILGNPTQVHQMLMNLCTNAAQAMDKKGGRLFVGLRENPFGVNQNKKTEPCVEITISDTGEGISPEHVGSIFDPYFTTKEVGKGTGMGLAVAQGIVESYGGRIEVVSKVGKGTSFTVSLPITRKSKRLYPDHSEVSPRGTERILFVDDEASIVRMGGLMLERLGYGVTTRTSSIEALALLKAKPEAFDLVITDMTMPNMMGDELALEVMKISPDLPVILCTGYSNKISAESAADIGIRAFVYKPVIKADMAKTVREVLDGAKTRTAAESTRVIKHPTKA